MPDESHAGRMVRDVVLEIVKDSDGVTVQEIAEILETPAGVILTICNELVRDGYVILTEDGDLI